MMGKDMKKGPDALVMMRSVQSSGKSGVCDPAVHVGRWLHGGAAPLQINRLLHKKAALERL